MKTKPIIIITAIAIVLIVGIVFFIKSKNHQAVAPDESEIATFLDKFNNGVKNHDTHTLLSCFAPDVNIRSLKKFAKLLAGKPDKEGNKPLTDILFHTEKYETKDGAGGIVVVTIPVSLSHGTLDEKSSSIILKIGKTSKGALKIVQADVREFVADYESYTNFVKSKTVPMSERFKPITLAAFKNAAQLKTKYDSVIWFDHVDGRTFFYVVKGKWDRYSMDSLNDAGFELKYQMGLVDPGLKEIIPPKFDLVHNVSGTVDGLVEVEKDEKKGFYDLNGKNVVPVEYDQIFPLKDSLNVALMRNGDDYFYLKKDFAITEKVAGLSIADVCGKIKSFGESYTWSDSTFRNVMEYNSMDFYNSIILPPSYLVDLHILPRQIDFENPLRNEQSTGDGTNDEDEEGGDRTYAVSFDGKGNSENNLFETAFYSIVDDYIGGRGGLYEAKNVLLIDKKQNRLIGFNANSYHGRGEGGGDISGSCKENAFRALNDTLFEFKTTGVLEAELLNGELLNEGPYYHYLHLVKGQLVQLPCERKFPCAMFVKLDDSYLAGCYTVDKNTYDHMTPEILAYMKNEIYAAHDYQFKNKKWADIFNGEFGREENGKSVNVDNTLNDIEKYNVAWITNKLNSMKNNKLAAR